LRKDAAFGFGEFDAATRVFGIDALASEHPEVNRTAGGFGRHITARGVDSYVASRVFSLDGAFARQNRYGAARSSGHDISAGVFDPDVAAGVRGLDPSFGRLDLDGTARRASQYVCASVLDEDIPSRIAGFNTASDLTQDD